jgi:colanic acid biosynthesis glycosyl transferase WcaI
MTQELDVVFVERYFFPEGWGGAQIPRDITAELARAGFKVAAVCGRDQYIAASAAESQDPRKLGVSIWYVPRYRLSKSSSKSILSQLWFCTIASMTIALRGRPALFMVQTNPPLVVVALSAIAAILRRPLILVAQDLYPEVMIAHGMVNRRSLLGRALIRVFRLAYQSAACVVSLSPNMTTRLTEKGVDANRIREICNWATGDPSIVRGSANKVLRQWDLFGRFVVLYSGNLGIAHDAETIVRAVAIASSQVARLRLVFVGEGGRIEATKRLVEELGLREFVLFRPSVPMELLPHTMGAADLALVTLLPGFEGLVVPSKLFGHMARGIPTMYIGPPNGDVAVVLAKSSGGIAVANGDIAAAAASLVELAVDRLALQRMGASAARYYNEHLSRELGLTAYRKLVESVISKESQ